MTLQVCTATALSSLWPSSVNSTVPAYSSVFTSDLSTEPTPSQQHVYCSSTDSSLQCRGGKHQQEKSLVADAATNNILPLWMLPWRIWTGQPEHKVRQAAKVVRSSPIMQFLGNTWYGKVPHPVRYFVSGNLGNICFISTERLVALSLPFVRQVVAAWADQRKSTMQEMMDDIKHAIRPKASLFNLLTFANILHVLDRHGDSVCFLTGYMLHIVAQHYLHALLVYGLDSINTPSKYWTTLRGTYSALITSAIGSTIVNAWLLHWGLKKHVALLATLWIFACINYVWLNSVVQRAKRQAAEKSV